MEFQFRGPGAIRSAAFPPTALTRSRMATSPSPFRGNPWPLRTLNPAPSSRMVQHCVKSSLQARIHRLLAFACFTAFGQRFLHDAIQRRLNGGRQAPGNRCVNVDRQIRSF